MLVVDSFWCSEFPIYCAGTFEERASFGCAWRLGAWLSKVASATDQWNLFGGSSKGAQQLNTQETDWRQYVFSRGRAVLSDQAHCLIKGAHGAITEDEGLNVLSLLRAKTMMEPNKVTYVAERSLLELLHLPLLIDIMPFLSNLWSAVMSIIEYCIALWIRLSFLDLIKFR